MQIVRAAGGQRRKICFGNGKGCGTGKGFGIAADIGTTTVAMGLYDLDTGKELGRRQEKNSQTLMGADVMMRLMHCRQGKQKQLQVMIREQLQEMIKGLCQGVCRDDEVGRMAAVGNPTMCHIFLGLDTAGLAGSPFKPAYEGAYSCRGADVGLTSFPQMEVYVVAGVDAHVGADAVAMAASLQMQASGGNRMAVDIGTNAEIFLSCGGRMIAGSAPAGPAFEGAGISHGIASHGMRGEAGAVAAFKIAPHAENVILDVIAAGQGNAGGELKPRGICGSGLIDIIAALRQCGLLQADGYLLGREEAQEAGVPQFLWERLTGDAFIVYQALPDYGGQDACRPGGAYSPGGVVPPGGDSSFPEGCVLLTRQDIRRFQLAKAAVRAGIRLLLRSQGLEAGQLERLDIAGVFGGNISVKNAVRVGMFPDVPPERLHAAGNAAGDGAAQALLRAEFCRETEELANRAGHLELAEQEDFREEFLAAMELAPFS